ncbi:MAG TPA: hypothetical protein VGJ84_11895, partial [Polyangiaceae bacterium]
MEIDDQRVVARAVRSVRPLRTGFIAGMRLGTLTVLTATLVSCGSAAQRSQTAPGQSSQSGTPDSRRPGAHRGAAKTDVAAMFQREASGLTDKSVRAADGRWTAVVPAASDPTQKADGSVAVVQIPIGAEGPVQCQVHSTRIDAGGALAGVLGAASQKVKFESIVPWAVTIVGTTPAAWIEAVYVVEKPEGKAAGHLKLAVLAQNDNS